MKKINILKKNREYNELITKGKRINSKEVIIYYNEEKINNYFFGFSVSKKLGNAVTRNKIKRQIKNILDQKNYKNGFKCIIMVKKDFLNKTYEEKGQIIFNLLNKIDIIKGEKWKKN